MHLQLPSEGIADVWCCNGGRNSRSMASHRPAERFLEEILSRYLGSDPKTVRVVRDPLGKPTIASPPSTRLGFSVSYSKDDLFVAVASARIGADVEDEDDHVRLDEVARRWLHPGEARRVATSSPRDRLHRFFQAWTLRESYLKAIGTGFRTAANAPEIVPADTEALCGDTICLGHVLLDQKRHLAVATNFPPRCFRIFHFGAANPAWRSGELPSHAGRKSTDPSLLPTAWRIR